jgi:hypothetical protein
MGYPHVLRHTNTDQGRGLAKTAFSAGGMSKTTITGEKMELTKN